MDASPATAHITRERVVAASIVALFFLLLFPACAAHAATLSFSPQSGTYFAGRSFSVSVLVSSPNQAMNAVQGEVSFPTNNLEVLSVSQTNSVITLWVQNPTFSNQDGTIDFGGVVPNPGFQGSGGNVITIRFEAKNSGAAALSFNSGSVLANDGEGTNILTAMGSANFTIAPLAAAPVSTVPTSAGGNSGVTAPTAVIINSSPSIVGSQWYNLNQITFNWSVPANAEGVDYTISTNPNLQLPDVSQGLVSQTSYDLSKFADGIWYFFVSFNDGSAWSPPTMEKLMLDRTPPQSFVISRVDTNLMDSQPVFAWVANDAASGIDHYQVKIGDGDWFDASIIENGSSSYMLPPQSPTADQTLTVRAFDKAGNYTDASLTFSVIGVGSTCAHGSSFACASSAFFSRWGWLVVGILIILLLLAYGLIYNILQWKKHSSKDLKKFEDELRRDLKAIQDQTEKMHDGAVDLRSSHLAQEKRQLEKEIKHISDDVKEEIKELGEK